MQYYLLFVNKNAIGFNSLKSKLKNIIKSLNNIRYFNGKRRPLSDFLTNINTSNQIGNTKYILHKCRFLFIMHIMINIHIFYSLYLHSCTIYKFMQWIYKQFHT